jgi:hypothetical protein
MVLKTHMMSASRPLLRRPVLEQRLDALPTSASPLLHSLLQFWSDAVSEDGVPSRNRLDVFALRPWLGHISIYEAVDGGDDFLIHLEGTAIVAITGEDWTGKRASEVDARYGCHIPDFMREIARAPTSPWSIPCACSRTRSSSSRACCCRCARARMAPSIRSCW